MEEYITAFTMYIKNNYDTDNGLVQGKYNHSIRVAKIISTLAKQKGLNEKDQKLAFFIGLFHDLGRFYEAKKNERFNNLSLDHGAYSNKILYNDEFIKTLNIERNDEIDLIIRKALYFHNKIDLDTRIKTEKEEMFVKLLRDADKLDIVKNRIEKGNLFFKDNPTGYMIRNFMNDEMLDLAFLHNKSDSVIFYLSFLKDLYYPESHAMAMEDHLLEKFQDAVVVSDENKTLFDVLINKVREKYVQKGQTKRKELSIGR